MKGIAISVVVFGIFLIIALALIALIYLKLIPAVSDYLNNLMKKAVDTIICMFLKGVTFGLFPC
jgi:hypothetical protein